MLKQLHSFVGISSHFGVTCVRKKIQAHVFCLIQRNQYILMKLLPFSFSAFESVPFSDRLRFFFQSCSVLASVLFLGPKLGEKGINEECGVRYRRSSQHPFPLKFPCPPPQIYGLDQLRTKNNIPL